MEKASGIKLEHVRPQGSNSRKLTDRQKTEALLGRAAGLSQNEVAEATGISSTAISTLERNSPERLAEMLAMLQHLSLGKVLGKSRRWLAARMEAWTDPKCRTVGPELRAMLDLWHGPRGINVHVGDTYVNVDARSIHVPSDRDELRDRLSGLEERFGLSR